MLPWPRTGIAAYKAPINIAKIFVRLIARFFIAPLQLAILASWRRRFVAIEMIIDSHSFSTGFRRRDDLVAWEIRMRRGRRIYGKLFS
jgi:hypothetical protein